MEELETEIAVGELIDTVEYDYPGFHLSMDCFWCEIVNGDLVLKEHEAARWLTREGWMMWNGCRRMLHLLRKSEVHFDNVQENVVLYEVDIKIFFIS